VNGLGENLDVLVSECVIPCVSGERNASLQVLGI
jgi:hypothetical protein